MIQMYPLVSGIPVAHQRAAPGCNSRREEALAMKVLGRITVFPIMPARISRLYELAYIV